MLNALGLYFPGAGGKFRIRVFIPQETVIFCSLSVSL